MVTHKLVSFAQNVRALHLGRKEGDSGLSHPRKKGGSRSAVPFETDLSQLFHSFG